MLFGASLSAQLPRRTPLPSGQRARSPTSGISTTTKRCVCSVCTLPPRSTAFLETTCGALSRRSARVSLAARWTPPSCRGSRHSTTTCASRPYYWLLGSGVFFLARSWYRQKVLRSDFSGRVRGSPSIVLDKYSV